MMRVALLLVTACGNRSTSSTSDTCKPVPMCKTFAMTRVDAMCGSKTTSVNPFDVAPEGQLLVDSCEYMNDKRESEVTLVRTCFPGSVGGTAMAKQTFETDMAKKGQTDLQADAPGIGDQAYYRVTATATQAQLTVRKANSIITVQTTVVSGQTLPTVEKQCLVALYNEVVAK